MFDEILSRTGTALDRHTIPYMIIGGQAVLLHGEPRLTRDIDITLGVNIDRLETILDLARETALTPHPGDGFRVVVRCKQINSPGVLAL